MTHLGLVLKAWSSPCSSRREQFLHHLALARLDTALIIMAYVAPIHKATSIRHALKVRLLDPDIEDLVVA